MKSLFGSAEVENVVISADQGMVLVCAPRSHLGRFAIVLLCAAWLYVAVAYLRHVHVIRGHAGASLPCCASTLAPAAWGAPKREGRFVYMITGRGVPGHQWRELSEQAGVFVLFAAWDYHPHSRQLALYDQLIVYYYPDSSWSTCRNFLYSKALALEKELAEEFEYFIFADEDVRMGWRTAAYPKSLHMDNSLEASLWLHKQLIRDKPARASTEYAATPRIDVYPVHCVQSCAFDGALDIYHRSIVRFLLPYFSHFDSESWQMAQFIMNLRSQTLIDDYCHLYRDVFIDPNANRHAHYPTNYQMITNATLLVSNCLARNGLSMATRDGESEQQAVKRALQRPRPNNLSARNCTAQPRNIDYGKLLRPVLQYWPVECTK